MGKAMLQTEVCCHQYQAWDCSVKGKGHPKACCFMLAAGKAQPMKEPWVDRELDETGSQCIPREV